MLKQAIPSFSFPTTVFMIDDNVEFLKSIAIGLPSEAATYNFYSDPKKALELINEKYTSNRFARGLVNLIDEEEFEHRTLDVNVRDLYRIMYNKSRFQQISTVVVDYNMPGMDGIEFCKSIKNPHIQKILLTSIVDERKAVEVLNEGLIHTFIRKQSPNVMQLLSQALSQAQQRYFLDLSRNNFSRLSAFRLKKAPWPIQLLLSFFIALPRILGRLSIISRNFWAVSSSWMPTEITMGSLLA